MSDYVDEMTDEELHDLFEDDYDNYMSNLYGPDEVLWSEDFRRTLQDLS